MADDPKIEDLETAPKKTATDIYYPDASGGEVKVGLPPEPSARSVSGEVGLPGGAASDDLPEAGRKTLGDWLNNYTNKNITPPPDALGDATPTVNAADYKFADPTNVDTVYHQMPNAGIPFDEETSTSDLSAKPYGKEGKANTLLRDAWNPLADCEGGGTLVPASSDAVEGEGFTAVGIPSVVLARNRFSPAAGGFGDSLGKGGNAWSNTQKLKGTSDDSPEMASSLGRYSKDWDGIAMEELANVAEQLLLNAVGDHKTTFGDRGAATGELGGGLIGAQLGRGRDQFNADTDFRPDQAIRPAYGEGRKSGDFINGQMNSLLETPNEDLKANKDYVRRSFGALNNHLEPFASALPTSMILLAAVAAITSIIAAIVLALILDILGLAFTLGQGSLKPDPIYQSGDPSKMPLGSAFGDTDYGSTDFLGVLYRLFGLPALDGEYENNPFPFTTAATFGSLEFFIGNSLQKPFAFPQIMSNSAGYYVVVVRNALRDMDQISDAASEMSSADFVSAIEGFFALIDAFVTSATFRFLLTLIQIGDRVICGPGLFGKKDSDGRVVPTVLPEHRNTGKYVKDLGPMVRLNSTTPTLAYSFSALPQLYIRPTEAYVGHSLTPTSWFEGAEEKTMLDNFADYRNINPGADRPAGLQPLVDAGVHSTDILMGSSVMIGSDPQKPFMNRLSYVENGRIPTKFRQAMEDELDAYYVPFYFHDLRTNEILPMPCFVSSISDSFSPSYSEISGFGRLDPVQIYGGTTRKIGFQFYMVATSESDYSALYYGINKLVSMVYPQWSEGRTITNAAGQTFTVPYSSVMTASPLIRLRLGELFASNRSPETVRRLFGAHKGNFSMGEQDDGNPLKPSHLVKEPGISPEMLKAVVERGKKDPLQPSSYGLIYATNIIAGPAGIAGDNTLTNFAGCAPNGTGGVQTMTGESFLLPVGKLISFPDKRLKAGEWTGMKWKKRGGQYARKKGTGTVGEIINYAAFPNKEKTASEKRGGALNNDIYYVVVPPTSGLPYGNEGGLVWQNPDGAKHECTGVLVPISSTELFIPLQYVEPEEEGGIPTPFEPPPPPPPVTDDEFFQGNIIVKSMEAAGGKGIAGVIKSLDFDWNEATWETDSSRGRAPQWVKVTMTFSPIHDEPLGLSADGSLRAPAYPVGNYIRSIFGERFALPGQASPGEAMSLLAQAQARMKGEKLSEETPEPEI